MPRVSTMRLSFIAIIATLVLAGLSGAAPVTNQDGATHLAKRFSGFHLHPSSPNSLNLETRGGRISRHRPDPGPHEPVHSGLPMDPPPYSEHAGATAYPPRPNRSRKGTIHSFNYAYGGQDPSAVRHSPAINPHGGDPPPYSERPDSPQWEITHSSNPPSSSNGGGHGGDEKQVPKHVRNQ
ncbi:hypothetical protein AX17_004764 [Amanita inopinata Kibby_2008]|nr:hypothetical protein AX17_004764 [Amanita inopinata Kibby_2008]